MIIIILPEQKSMQNEFLSGKEKVRLPLIVDIAHNPCFSLTGAFK